MFYNERFFLVIGCIARNEQLMSSLRRILIEHARLGITFYCFPTTDNMQRDLDSAFEPHEPITDAMERYKVEGVASIIREHLVLSILSTTVSASQAPFLAYRPFPFAWI